MEVSALTKMLIRLPEKKGVSICGIITEGDSNGRSKSRHVANHGVLPPNIKEPIFRADPSHRKCVFANQYINSVHFL
jgi:hypothetical protein